MSAPTLIYPATSGGGTPVGGSGTSSPSTIPRWTGATTLGDSIISQDTNARAIGIGVTPSATWDTSYRAIQLGQTASAMAASAAAANWWTQNNGIWDGTNWKYTAAGAGAQYAQIGGEHRFSYVAAGAAGANFTWSRAVTIDGSGNVGIGTASPNAQLAVYAASLPTFSLWNATNHTRFAVNAGDCYVDVGFGGAAGSIIFRRSSSATESWRINSSGHFLAGADNTYDIGASGATRPRTVYVGTGVVGGYIRAGAASAGVASTTTIGNGTSTTATAGAQTLPANPLGFIIAHVGTTEVRIPYYAV